MLKFVVIGLFFLLIGVHDIHGWDFDYIDIRPEEDVTDVTFRMYSTLHAESEWDSRDILFDEETGEATLEDAWFFNSSIETKIIAHGNGGGYLLARSYYLNYTEVADKVGKHYNVIAMYWGKGGEKRHAWSGIKTAKVVKSFVEKYGLKIEDIHGIGFSFGAHVINAMATELNDIGLGKIDRLTLLEPGCKVPKHNIDGKTQFGLIHKDDASFVDAYHTSMTGIWQMAVADVDVWINGGKGQPPNMHIDGMDCGPHRSATWYFSRTILMTLYDQCHYNAWQCIDPEWSSYAWVDRNDEDTCDFGDPETENAIQVVGEYINRDEPFISTGNFVFFTNDEFKFCENFICDQFC